MKIFFIHALTTIGDIKNQKFIFEKLDNRKLFNIIEKPGNKTVKHSKIMWRVLYWL